MGVLHGTWSAGGPANPPSASPQEGANVRGGSNAVRRQPRVDRKVRGAFSAAVIAVVSIFAAGAAGAQNLVTNGDFASGISGWHLVGRGTLSPNSDGANSTGSLQAEGGLAGDAMQAVAGQCIAISPSQGFTFSASVRVATGAPSYCRVALFESERSDCQWLDLGAEVRRTTFSGGWDGLSGGSLISSTETGSIELRLHCANSVGDRQPLEVRFDTVSVETEAGLLEIFSDDFETGGTGRWSSTLP